MLLCKRPLIPYGVLTPASAFYDVLNDMLDDFSAQGLLFTVESQRLMK